MDPILLIVLLYVLALGLAAAETLLPTHGALGVASFIAALAAVGVGFGHDRTVGVALLIGTLIATPVVALVMLRLWEISPIGRRLTLNESGGALKHEPIRVGDVGVTASALRPMGEADFGPVTVQVLGHHGVAIAAGTRVRVVSYEDGVAHVEPIAAKLA